MKKISTFITSIAIILVFSLVFMLAGSGCTGFQDTVVTAPVAVESATVETTLIEIPATEATTVEKIAENFELLYVPKIIPPEQEGQEPWFATIKAGLEQCARDYGFKVTVVGPERANPAIQAQIVLDNIAKNFSAIVVCPIDEAIIDSAFERANNAGVMTFSNEGYKMKNVTFNIEPVTGEAFGQAMMKSAINYTGGAGNYIMSVGFLNSSAHNEWADAAIAYQQSNATGLINLLGYMKGTDRFEDNEDQKIALEKLTEFVNLHKDLNLIIGNSFSTGIAAGELILKKKLKDKLFYVGVGMPATIGKYISDGAVQEGFFWDPYLLGYSIGYISFNSWMEKEFNDQDSVLKPDGTKVEGYENLQISINENGGMVISGNALVSVNKGNLETWNKRLEGYGWPQN